MMQKQTLLSLVRPLKMKAQFFFFIAALAFFNYQVKSNPSPLHQGYKLPILKPRPQVITANPMDKISNSRWSSNISWQKRRIGVNNDQRVVKGKPADKNQFPHQVSLRCHNDLHFCGGSILTEKTVITAAHCCLGLERKFQWEISQKWIDCEKPIEILVGTTKNNRSYGQLRNITKYIVHPDYKYASYHNDVCLIFPDQPLDLNGLSIAPIQLGDDESCKIDSQCTVSGWGYTEYGGCQSKCLMYAEIPIRKPEDCYLSSQFDSNTEFCAGYLNGSYDACNYDSGGPLGCGKKLCGLVSYGEKCAEPNYPGVYTAIPKFIDWIKKNTV